MPILLRPGKPLRAGLRGSQTTADIARDQAPHPVRAMQKRMQETTVKSISRTSRINNGDGECGLAIQLTIGHQHGSTLAQLDDRNADPVLQLFQCPHRISSACNGLSLVLVGEYEFAVPHD